jgi:hypothetical protein
VRAVSIVHRYESHTVPHLNDTQSHVLEKVVLSMSPFVVQVYNSNRSLIVDLKNKFMTNVRVCII